jgi:hypothetical protein
MRLTPPLPQLLARRILVFLDDPVGELIQEWMLRAGYAAQAQQ